VSSPKWSLKEGHGCHPGQVSLKMSQSRNWSQGWWDKERERERGAKLVGMVMMKAAGLTIYKWERKQASKNVGHVAILYLSATTSWANCLITLQYQTS
jgi:hypothetical protein